MNRLVVTLARRIGPFPRQRSRVEGFPKTGLNLVGRPDGVRREKELLSARKPDSNRPPVPGSEPEQVAEVSPLSGSAVC